MRTCKKCKQDKPLDQFYDHFTNKVRGLLCLQCNQGLGQFKDNLDSLKSAIKYLEK